MTGLTFPIILTFIGLVVALSAYRNVRRGASRYYTLEREAILRQASLTIIASVFFFLAAIALLIFNVQQVEMQEVIDTGEVVEGLPTMTPTISVFPPTPSPFPTSNINVPTATSTPIVRRAIVDGTGAAGLYLREEPGGLDIDTLPDGSILTLVDEEPQTLNNITWLKVRTITGTEGWVAETFLIIRDR